jgi:hypothetical protein
MLSASNCVAKMTLTFFPEVLSHCRMRAVKDGSSRNSHASLRISNAGTLSKQTRGSGVCRAWFVRTNHAQFLGYGKQRKCRSAIVIPSWRVALCEVRQEPPTP